MEKRKDMDPNKAREVVRVAGKRENARGIKIMIMYPNITRKK